MARKLNNEDLELQIKTLEKERDEKELTQKAMSDLSEIFDRLGTDPKKNIDIIVQQTCDLLHGTCSLYNRLDDKRKSLIAWSSANLPNDFKMEDIPTGHICYEATIKGKNSPVILEDISDTVYQESDSNVKKYNLKSYLGYPISLNNKAIGALCIVDIKKRYFNPTEVQIISTLAKAVSLEEARKQAAENLIQYENIVSVSNDHMALLDSNFTYRLVNDAYLKGHGKNRGEIIGHSVPDLFGQEFFENIQKLRLERCLKGETVQYQAWIDFPVSGRRYMDILYSPYKNENHVISGCVVTSRDITERKIAEDKLQRNEKKLLKSEKGFRDLFDSINDLVYTQSLDGRFISVNPAMNKLFGYEMDEFIGHRSSEFMNPELEHLFISEYLEKIKRHGSSEGVSSYFTKFGNKIYLEYRSALVQQEDGDSYISGIARDVTERIMAEREIKKLQEEIIQSHKMEAIGTLTGGIAHDFNNILGIIIGNTELALDDVPQWNSGHFNLEEIKTASIRAKDIVRQLLSYSRRTAQKLKPIEIAPIIKDSIKFLRSSIPASIEIHQNIHAKEVIVMADPIQINQIMLNLCANASHSMEQTGGTLTITIENMILDKNSSDIYPELDMGSYIRMTVKDTGKGIDTKIIDRIFDPYFTTKEVGKGSGMGLAVVQGIIKNHNGAISVASQVGEGTVFDVLFPLAAEKPSTESDTSVKIVTGNEKILFVDDEEKMVTMAGKMLERLGYKVVGTSSPIDALEHVRLKPEHFDLVITDMTMPQMTGTALSKKLKNIRPDLPVIICTGHSPLINEKKAGELGIAAYITKPILKHKMSETIRNVLDR